jgi:hypothetical protein
MTAQVALEKQIERYRQMTGEERLGIALNLHEMACDAKSSLKPHFFWQPRLPTASRRYSRQSCLRYNFACDRLVDSAITDRNWHDIACESIRRQHPEADAAKVEQLLQARIKLSRTI